MLKQWYTDSALPPHLNISDILIAHWLYTGPILALHCLSTPPFPSVSLYDCRIYWINSPNTLACYWTVHCMYTEGALLEFTEFVLNTHCVSTSFWSGSYVTPIPHMRIHTIRNMTIREMYLIFSPPVSS